MRAAASAILIVLATALFAGAAMAAAVTRPEPSALAVKSDRDSNKVFDDLEYRLALAQSAELVEVIVQLREPATLTRAASIAHDAGGFSVSQRFSLVNGFAAAMTSAQIRALAGDPRVLHVEETQPSTRPTIRRSSRLA